MKKIVTFVTEELIKITIILVVVVIAVFSLIYMNRTTDDFWYEIYKSRTELKYWSSKDSLVTEIDNYIITVAPQSTLDGLYLLNKCLEYNVDIVFVLAQATLESHLGTSGMAKKTNSVFNVGAYDGKTLSNISSKHKFDNPNLSIEPYLILLNNRYLDGKSERELLNNFVDKDGKRYASYINYEKELLIIINKIEDSTNITSTYMNFLKYQNLTCR